MIFQMFLRDFLVNNFDFTSLSFRITMDTPLRIPPIISPKSPHLERYVNILLYAQMCANDTHRESDKYLENFISRYEYSKKHIFKMKIWGSGGRSPPEEKINDPQIKIFEIFSQDPIFEGGYP